MTTTSPIVYHGTFENFEKFDKSKLGTNTESPYQGFFFASNKNVAISYASNILRKLKDCMKIRDHATEEIKKLTRDSYVDSLFKYIKHEYNEDIDKKLSELYEMITACDDYEAGVIEFSIAYDSDLDESGTIRQAKLYFKNPLIHNMKESDYRDVSYVDLVLKAKFEGHDGLIIKNTYDGGDPVGGLE